jgi:hypothetical protein
LTLKPLKASPENQQPGFAVSRGNFQFKDAGFPPLRQPFFFFLPDVVYVGKHFFQFGKGMPSG